MQTHIWAPLSMARISFDPDSPAIAASLADSTLRGPHNSFLPSPSRFFREGTQFNSVGAGLFASPAEYAKLLAAVLRDDGTLLRPETMALLFEPQLSPEMQETFDAAVYAEGAEALSQALPQEARLTQTLVGALCRADVEGRRGAGSLMWAGLANCYWSLDRARGVALFWGAQAMPTGDVKVLDGFRRFEEAVYGGLV